MEKFNAGWSSQVRIMTFLIGFMLILCFLSFGSKAYVNPTTYNIISTSVFTALMLAVILWSISSSPVWIAVNDNKIIVKKIFGKIEIPLSSITNIERRSHLGLDSKKLNTSGFFGFNGCFVNDAIGKYRCYVTDQNNIFWVMTTNQKYTLSCNEPEKFINLVKKNIQK